MLLIYFVCPVIGTFILFTTSPLHPRMSIVPCKYGNNMPLEMPFMQSIPVGMGLISIISAAIRVNSERFTSN